MIGLGVLYAIDCYGCGVCPQEPHLLRRALLTAARKAGLEVVEEAAHAFSEEEHGQEHGGSVITLVVPMRHSHIAVHSWPARRFVSIDFYTCADFDAGHYAATELAEAFEPQEIERQTFWRGIKLDR